MMMKKYGLITKVLLISMFAILLNGCENSLTSEFSSKANEAKFYTITGNIDVDAISAENSSRTGLPTIPSIDDNSIKFSVSATKDGEIITGTVTGNQYSITLLKGSWTITVIGEKAGVKVLEGSINVNTEEPTTQQTITLKIIKAETGTGSLSLTISISKEENLSCGGVKATLYKTSGDITENYLTFTTTNNSTKWDVKDLPAGTYEIKLDFYQKMTLNADGEYSCKNLLYSHHDTVNVFANFATNTWTGSGYTENSFKLTQAMINNFAMTTFYVSNSGDDSKAGTYFAPFKTLQEAVTAINNKNDTSTEFTIYLLDGEFTLSEQIEISKKIKITTYNSKNTIAEIKRDSTFNNDNLIKVSSDGELTLANVTIDGNQVENDYSGIYVEGTLNLNDNATIQNCTASEGGGVQVANGGTFKMTGGTISGCKAEYGGGVIIYGNGEFEMSGGSITNCEAPEGFGGGVLVYYTKKTDTVGNVSYIPGKFNMSGGSTISGCEAGYGGAVCLDHGTFTMEDGSISNNKALEYGGGVYLSDSTSSFTMTGGVIGKKIIEETNSTKSSWEYAATGDEGKHSNYAGAGGGGIYVEDGNVTINGGKISYNYVPNPDEDFSTNLKISHGGGISVVKGNLTINNAEVSYNSGYQGAGIRCYNDKTSNAGTLTLNGTTIKGNASRTRSYNNFGGAICVKNFDINQDETSGTTTSTIVEENYTGDGGALFLENTTSTLENITIQNNSYDGYKTGDEVLLWNNANLSIGSSSVVIKSDEPKGIVISNNTNTLNLSGNAKLDAPVYLTNEAMVTVAGNLTSEGTVATITPDSYAKDTQVLAAGKDETGGDLVDLAEQVGKFAVTPDSNNEGVDWKINDNGGLLLTYSTWKALAEAIGNINATSSNSETELVLSGNLIATNEAIWNGTIRIERPVKITPYKDVTIFRGEGFTGVFFVVAGNNNIKGSLELCNITLDGGRENSIKATDPLIRTYSESESLTLTNCILQNNKIENDDVTYGRGGALRIETTATMNGGSIINCSANEEGGAVYIQSGSFTMKNDATISGCTAEKGGGVCVAAGGTFEMKNGSITGNTASSTVPHGAGVDVLGIFNMSGGSITENKLICEDRSNDLSCGGAGVAVEVTIDNGSVVSTGIFTMTGGTISGNTIDKKDNNTYKTNVYGTGVYVVSGASFSNNGGTISDEDIHTAQ